MDGLVNIWERSVARFFADQLVAEPGLVAIEPVLDQVWSAIAGRVVNDYYFDFVSGVVEVVNGLQVVVVSVPLCVVEGGCYDTERQFF